MTSFRANGKISRKKAQNWRKAIDRLEGAYSENTLRAYRADFATFEKWCQESHRRPLPASPKTIAAFIEHQAELMSSATLRRRQASIRKVHQLLLFPNPVESQEAIIAMRRALRTKSRRHMQALGLTQELRDKLIKAADPKSLAGLRNIALLQVGYDTLCRRAELSALRWEDLRPMDDGAMSILIRRAKNDPFGDGRLGLLSPKTVLSLRAWTEAAGIRKGWIFRRVHNRRKLGTEPLHPYSINRILKIMAQEADLPTEIVAALSGHSMRVGAAQDMMAHGSGILPIMQAGGWKSLNVVGRYVQHAELATMARFRLEHGDENTNLLSDSALP